MTAKATYYYYDKNIDESPVPVKIFQTGSKGKRVEISRDFNSEAGFWVDTNQLMVEKSCEIKDDGVYTTYSFIDKVIV